MSFDTDAEIPTEDLVKQWGVPHQTVASLISGAKRMSPDGGLAADFVERGFPVETHPAWFGGSHQTAGKGGGQGGGGGGGGDLGEVDGEEVADMVFTPKEPVPKEQYSQVTHTAAQRSRLTTWRGRSTTWRGRSTTWRGRLDNRRHHLSKRHSRIFFSRTASPTRWRTVSG